LLANPKRDKSAIGRRKLIETMESDKPNVAKPYWVDRAIDEAAFVLERIDKRWPMECVSDGTP
jgi:hypothetical protein